VNKMDKAGILATGQKKAMKDYLSVPSGRVSLPQPKLITARRAAEMVEHQFFKNVSWGALQIALFDLFVKLNVEIKAADSKSIEVMNTSLMTTAKDIAQSTRDSAG